MNTSCHTFFFISVQSYGALFVFLKILNVQITCFVTSQIYMSKFDPVLSLICLLFLWILRFNSDKLLRCLLFGILVGSLSCLLISLENLQLS